MLVIGGVDVKEKRSIEKARGLLPRGTKTGIFNKQSTHPTNKVIIHSWIKKADEKRFFQTDKKEMLVRKLS
jgi:hypothetical protein